MMTTTEVAGNGKFPCDVEGCTHEPFTTERGMKRHKTVTHNSKSRQARKQRARQPRASIHDKVAEAVAPMFPKGIQTHDKRQFARDLGLIGEIYQRLA